MRMSSLTLLEILRATRGADTSMFDGDFSLRYRLKAGGGLGGSVKVMVRADGGGWDTVKTHNLGSPINEDPIALDQAFRSETFEVRFEYTAVLLGSPAFIDDVEIQGAIAEQTTTTSTTTTTVPQTTTTSPTTTSTTQAPSSTTSTTQPPVTTTTPSGSTGGTAGPITSPPSTTSTTLSTSSSTATTTTLAIGPGGTGGPDGPGSTLPPTSTSTTSTAEAIGGPDSGVGGIVPGTGIRASARGLQADFQGDLYGDIRTVSSVNGVDVQADYNMAVEVIESSWAWMVLLGLLVAYSIITGLDRRRGIDA